MCKRVRLLGMVLLMAICLVSCKSSNIALHQVVTNFSADVTVTMNESEICCTLTRAAEGVGTIAVTKPEALSSMCFLWQGNSYGLSYQGLQCTTEHPFLPNSSFAAALMNVLNASSQYESLKLVSQENGKAVFSGECDSGQFKIAVNISSGFIEEVTIDDLKLKATFTNQK